MSKEQSKLKQCLPSNWERKIDQFTGSPYYVNYKKETTSWDPPEGTTYRPYRDGEDENDKEVNDEDEDDEDEDDEDDDDNYNDLPPGWQRKLDPKTGQQYFVDHKTKTTQWEYPRGRCSLTETQEKDSASDGAVCSTSPTGSDSSFDLLKKNFSHLKSIFPKAENSLILLTLSNNDNDIQKTEENLVCMGFQRKDHVKFAEQNLDAKIEAENPAPPPKNLAEKEALKQQLIKKYKHVAEKLIVMALESVDFNENEACRILDDMVQEDIKKEKNATVLSEITSQPEIGVTKPDLKVAVLPISQSRESIKSDKIDKDQVFNRTPDYKQWKGPNKAIRKGPQGLAKGPNCSLLSTRSYKPNGPNPELRKGPKFGLAKGSIFSDVKSNEN